MMLLRMRDFVLPVEAPMTLAELQAWCQVQAYEVEETRIDGTVTGFRVTVPSGYTLSAQSSPSHYCSMRWGSEEPMDNLRGTDAEIAVFSPNGGWLVWPDNRQTVYGYVPVGAIQRILVVLVGLT